MSALVQKSRNDGATVEEIILEVYWSTCDQLRMLRQHVQFRDTTEINLKSYLAQFGNSHLR